MKIVFFLFLIFPLINFSGKSAKKDKELNFILFIDDDLVHPNKGSITECFFLHKEDTINIKLFPGKIVLNEKLFNNYDDSSNIIFNFSYKDICPNSKKYSYQINLKVRYLISEYLILKLYNFSEKENQKKFRPKLGYGYDLISPYFTSFYPRKSKKYTKNCY